MTFTLEPQDRSILVKWEELPLEYRNGIITEYQINYRRVVADVPVENIEQGIAPTARSFLIQSMN